MKFKIRQTLTSIMSDYQIPLDVRVEEDVIHSVVQGILSLKYE
jgi:hypothetical protein